MRKSIFKYTLSGTDDQVIFMPVGAVILTAQEQGGQIQLWAIVQSDSTTPNQGRVFRIYGTGHPLPDDPGQYIATVQLHEGSLVLHIFEAEES